MIKTLIRIFLVFRVQPMPESAGVHQCPLPSALSQPFGSSTYFGLAQAPFTYFWWVHTAIAYSLGLGTHLTPVFLIPIP